MVAISRPDVRERFLMMTVEEVISHLIELFRDELDDEDVTLTPETTAADVPDWDSLTNIRLVVAIEKKYGVAFTSAEIQEWRNVGDMCAAIIAKAA